MSVSDDCDTPKSYTDLMDLDPQGVVSLNLDRFAGDAVAATGRKFTAPIYGTELAEKWNYQIENKKHLIYLHGDIINPSTWVMTHDDLNVVRNSQAHELFLKEKYLRNIVLFVGISADDVALSMRLLDLAESGLRPPNVFWLTNRSTDDLRAWANRHYVKLIRYQAHNSEDHSRIIRKMVDDCLSYMPDDEKLKPQKSEKDYGKSYVNPDDLVKMSPENIRHYLSGQVNSIIAEAGENNIDEIYRKYRDLCNVNDFAIHTAFYKNKEEKFRTWFD